MWVYYWLFIIVDDWNVFINTQVAVEYEMCRLGTNEVKMPDWLPKKYFIRGVKGKLCSKFVDDRPKTELTMFAV